MVRQCTRCELRFRSEGEVNEHLRMDHGPGAPSLDRYRYAPRTSQAPLYPDLDADAQAPPRRYLVVANQTLGTDEVQAAVRRRLEAGPAEFHVIAPATHSRDYPAAEPQGSGIRSAPDEAGAAMARWRVRRMIEGLTAAGASAAGEVGPPDPYVAAGTYLEETPVDEVIFCTLPPDISRWEERDVPTRIRRRFHVPVTVVTAALPSGSPTGAASGR
jgi:hypothetical protein